MRKIFAIAWKDTLVRFSSRTELLFFIILPVVFIFILSGGPRGPKQDGRVVLPIADDAASPASRALIAAIDRSATVRPVRNVTVQGERRSSGTYAPMSIVRIRRNGISTSASPRIAIRMLAPVA